MKRQEGYLLHSIDGVPYLLPFGQNIAAHKRGVRLNETGVVLWNLLETEKTKEQILQEFFDYYEASEEDYETMKKDADVFFQMLENLGIIEMDEDLTYSKNRRIYDIAGIRLSLCGPDEAIHASLSAFEITEKDNKTADCDLTVRLTAAPCRDRFYGKLLIKNDNLMLFYREPEYIMEFPKFKGIERIYLNQNGQEALVYVHRPFDPAFTEDFFHALRFVYLYTAQKKQIFALHSASILYKGKAWLFSGPSGTGKSTHTKLWNRFFETPYINGDLNLLGFSDGKPAVLGLPWCGTSGLFDTASYPLGGIILLRQAKENRVLSLSEDEKALLISQRLISPAWTSDQLSSNLEFAERLAGQILVCRLCCNMEQKAAEVMRDQIDCFLEKDQ